MEYTIAALALVLLLTIFIARLVMAGARQDGPPNGDDRRDDAAQERPPEDEPRIEIESEKLSNRPR